MPPQKAASEDHVPGSDGLYIAANVPDMDGHYL